MAIRFTPIDVAAPPPPRWDAGPVSLPTAGPPGAGPAAGPGALTGPADPLEPGVRVVLAPGVEATALEHFGTARVERGGLLIGVPYRGADTEVVTVVRIHRCVPAVQSDGTAVSLSMGTAVWACAREQLEHVRSSGLNALEADALCVVGWYHSHPGLGAFFSGTDRRTQAAFFQQPWSIGWVVDPLRREEAWFCGPQATPIGRLPGQTVASGSSAG